jgi:hypothetical protein
MLTTYHHPVPLSRNLGTLTSWNPLDMFRPVMGLLYLYLLATCFGVNNPRRAELEVTRELHTEYKFHEFMKL